MLRIGVFNALSLKTIHVMDFKRPVVGKISFYSEFPLRRMFLPIKDRHAICSYLLSSIGRYFHVCMWMSAYILL